MHTTTKPLLTLTASDLMTRDVIRLTDDTPLRDAAQLLLNNEIGGAPVVDAAGRCVGVLSAIDILRLAVSQARITGFASSPLPVTCSFQVKHRTPEGEQLTLCTLPLGVCPIQVKKTGAGGEDMIVCREPNCVMADWQMVNVEKLPADPVRQYMTADPVLVPASTSIRDLARRMVDAHIHRLIVGDEAGKPLGIVSSTDLLAALAYAK